ncbi:MAG: hypothetical protein AW08_00657 [Candidatus Accumulibacter adjunctus]|uniref:Uncharacterized protein n=1 Tax=Candidatus Accumulibacter adjunctus TaxID=1454001 RepID=A0A011NW38_9PROT|nr:MAG: hypothetical protein AW08_00657 [Candidatus Accumulibacter adjunctus]
MIARIVALLLVVLRAHWVGAFAHFFRLAALHADRRSACRLPGGLSVFAGGSGN